MVCKLDCLYQEEDFDRVIEIYENGVRLENRLRSRLKKIFRQSKKDTIDIARHAEELYQAFSKENNVLVNLMANLLRISNHRKEMSPVDDSTLRHVADIFCFPPQAYHLLKQEYCKESENEFSAAQPMPDSSESEDVGRAASECPKLKARRQAALRTLGCKDGATEANIREAFRKLALIYHPDIHASIPLSDEFNDDINRRFREIQSAYELLIAQ
jgi:DnaJ-domain-containing protein 1